MSKRWLKEKGKLYSMVIGQIVESHGLKAIIKESILLFAADKEIVLPVFISMINKAVSEAVLEAQERQERKACPGLGYLELDQKRVRGEL